MSDEKLSQQVDEYAKLAKENPNIDMGLLMANALQNQRTNTVSAKAKHWAYLIAVGVPPFGLFFAAKYYMSDEDDAKEVGRMCIILTVISVVMFFAFGKLFFSSAGVTPQQIEQIKPSDIQQLYQ